MELKELVAYLDDYLQVRELPDYPSACNGLQVEGTRPVRLVACAVDACQYTIDSAVTQGADILLVHHGLFWGERAPLTGSYYRRLSALIRAGVAVYSCHLPLDAHPEVGNNAVLSRALGLEVSGHFAEFNGLQIGATCDADVSRDELMERLASVLGVNPHLIATGPERVRRVAMLTGGGGRFVGDADVAGCDTLITGEGSHQTYFDAEERRLNLIYAGHYATETVGVRVLGEHLHSQFGIDALFIDHPTGL